MARYALSSAICVHPTGLLSTRQALHHLTCAENSSHTNWNAKAHSAINTPSTVPSHTWFHLTSTPRPRPFPSQCCNPTNNVRISSQKSMDELTEGLYTFQFCVSPNIGFPTGSNLPRNLWVTLHRFKTGVGRFGTDMCLWGLRVRQPRAYAGKRIKQHGALFITARPPDRQTSLITWRLPV